MNNSRPTTYTPLETLFLFQLISKYGFINGSFDRISNELQSTPLVLEQPEYDAGRLTPEALQQLALQLLHEEQRREAEAIAERGVNGLSPTSKKRKLQSPPLPTLKEAHEHPNKLPILVDRLYARFRDDLIKQIREDERLYQQREREIHEIERGEWDERIRQERPVDVVSNGIPSEKDVRLSKPNGHVTPTSASTPPLAPAPAPTPASAPVPAPTPVAIQAPVPVPPRIQEPVKKIEPKPASTPPTLAPHPAPAGTPPTVAPGITPAPAPAPAPASTPSTTQAAAPQIQQEKRPLQPVPSALAPAPTPPARTANEPRHIVPDGRPKPEPVRTPSSTTSVLQHPLAPGYGPRPASTPQPQLQAPDGVQRPESLPKAKSPVPGQQGQPAAPALKWEPLYQPQQQPHQTPVPSPRPPYVSGTARPPNYPHAQPGTPQAHQHAQNYIVGRPGAGQAAQSHFQTPTTSSPSHPVLLAPQNAGPLPPSLQPLPPNGTSDGTGQYGQNQRPLSVPPAVSPTPNVVRNPYPQHQPSSLATPTPVRPPSGLVAPHPAMAVAKPSTPTSQAPQPSNSGRISQPQSHPRPQPPLQQQQQPHSQQQQYPNPTTPSQPQQPQGLMRPYFPPYNQQPKPAGGLDLSQRPQLSAVPSQVSTPRPILSQPQTPIGFSESPYVVRGHGTKWTATPTPATPRMKDIGGYFDLESPAYEPISPPLPTARLPKPPSEVEAKSSHKSSVGTDSNKSRVRSSRAVQGVETASKSEEAPNAPEPSPPEIKNEEATPQTLQEAADTAPNEKLKDGTLTVTSGSSNKRKRQDSPISRGPSTPATHVLWTRAFHKISMTALDQIIGHRYANMFAHPIKPRLAPGYYDIILRPQDLKGIQKAITAGSKAAAAAVATMPDADANAPAVWLPISVDLVPPRGIINIAQLERELIHMFANAIMYNPDPLRGLGPSFLKSYQSNSEEGEDLRGYEFDENGVVKETRNMYAEVEKLLGDLRNEVVPRTQVVGTGSRSVSAAVGESTTVEDDGDEQAGDAKRRRIRG